MSCSQRLVLTHDSTAGGQHYSVHSGITLLSEDTRKLNEQKLTVKREDFFIHVLEHICSTIIVYFINLYVQSAKTDMKLQYFKTT